MITGDVGQLRDEIKSGGRSLHEFTAAETGRVMDMRWLKSPGARFRLVGVVNRLDRRDFHDLRGEAGCGEMRLIFRLAYSFRKDGKGKILSSRMPFNFNAVYDVLPDRRRRLRGGGVALAAGRRRACRCRLPGRRTARSPARAVPPAGAQRADRALSLRPGAAVRRPGRLSHAHLRHRRRPDRRAAAGEHARRGAPFAGCSAQGRARRLCPRQCAGHRPGRLHDPGQAAGAQGDLLLDLRQCAAGQPSVLAAAVAAGFCRPRSFRRAAWCARPRRCWSGWTTAPARGATSRAPPPASTSSASTTSSPRRSTASRWGFRRISTPSCRAATPMSRRLWQGASRTGSGRCRSPRRPAGKTLLLPMPMPTSRCLA